MEDQLIALQTVDKASQIEKEEILSQLGRVTSQAVSTEAESCYLRTQLAAATADCEVEKAMHRQCKATLTTLESELQSVRSQLVKEQDNLREQLSSADSISTMQSDACRGVYSYVVLRCTLLCYTVLYCTVLYCTVLYCTVLYCTVLYCTVLYCTVLYCTVLYCTVLYCTVLYCVDL